MKKVVSLIIILMTVGCVFGTEIYLRNGTVLYGKIQAKTDEHIVLYDYYKNELEQIKLADILKIYSEDESDVTSQILSMENFNNIVEVENEQNALGSQNYFNESFDPNNTKVNNAQNSLKNKSRLSHHHRTGNFRGKPEYKFNFRAGLITLPLLALSWNFFSDASDLSDAIDAAEHNDLPTSELKKERNMKSAVGVICVASGLINFVLSFEEVEVKASPTSVSLGYKF